MFIPPHAIGSAMHGDQVLVELGRKPDEDGPKAASCACSPAGNPTVVGTFHRGPRQNYVTPIDEKVTQEIMIPRGHGVAAGRGRSEDDARAASQKQVPDSASLRSG